MRRSVIGPFGGSLALLVTVLFSACSDTTGPVVATLSLDPSEVTLSTGDTITLLVSAEDALGINVANPGVTWSSSNDRVATVDQVGHVTATGEGNATITAAANGRQATAAAEVTVSDVSRGRWRGATNDGRAISFEINGAGQILDLAVELILRFGSFGCTGTALTTDFPTINDFEATLIMPSPFNEVTTVLRGTIDDDEAFGTYAGWTGDYSGRCGSFTVFGNAQVLKPGTWSASPVASAAGAPRTVVPRGYRYVAGQ